MGTELWIAAAALIGVALTIIKMWSTFNSKLIEFRLEIELKIKELEVDMNMAKAAILKKDLKINALSGRHDKDISKITETVNCNFEKMRMEQNEKHETLSHTLSELNTNLANLTGSYQMYLEMEKRKQKGV